VEEFGRVDLWDAEAAALVRSKAMHMVLLVTSVLVAVWSGDGGVAVLYPFLAFWLGGVAEAVATPGARAAEKVQRVGKATGAACLGLATCAACLYILW
jgi:hypothetical protein